MIGKNTSERSIHPALKMLKRSVDSVLASDNKKYIAKAYKPHGDVFKVGVL
ncbi:UNVERIFIED_CONTAM: hypothetical protein ABIC26_005229 [Paenibacillus sp. PvR008]